MLLKLMSLALWTVTALNSWADANLLDLLKSGKQQYATSSSCQKFIQSATHQTLKSPELQKYIRSLGEGPLAKKNFYHYTNSTKLAPLLKPGGYKSILEYQMTYADALSNISGLGFYLAANPFSSAKYRSCSATCIFL